ncbi:MAG: hypothetical protein A2234_07865 [Elusimicrobia bacterium RIFOXYA2_FULL_58_8]|nr:MAG: hypothetical protein A2234_07865 [Elusimicrobia bacterium RIFOXYA2_FULL_58_8]OGS13919.1 MAG: hypothetical protein A2285_10175 [Elusimicrobia bacterium RIFOXYA12_FULL_57_11]
MPAESIAARLNRLTLLENIPLGAQLELTYRCPLNCGHCYLPQTKPGAAAALKRELSTGEWRKTLKELKKLGTMSLVLTGGEPLLRSDLPALCRSATKLGFEIRIFSSGAGLTGVLARALRATNVSRFELSFYGRPAVHDAITGVTGSCFKTLAAARLLKKAGFKVKLKTPVMKANAGELKHITRLAKKYGFDRSFDPVLTIASDGEASNLARRLPAVRLAALLADPDINPVEKNYFPSPAPDSPPCGAGRNTVSINPYGDVFPCLQLGVKLGNLRKRPLGDIWKNNKWLKQWRKITAADIKACRNCADLAFCSRCPGVSLLEAGGTHKPYKTACVMARAARKAYARL